MHNYIESHSDAVARILFIYAKLNPGIRYVQGMNEILAVLYFCFWKHGHDAIIPPDFIESDLYFCFSNLMMEIRDFFMRELDKEANGIDGKCNEFIAIVELMDKDVIEKLKSENVEPKFYALRWLMLLLCQEYDLVNCITLWDALFADGNRFNFLSYVCAALVLNCREEILNGDFAECMENLQEAASKYMDSTELI